MTVYFIGAGPGAPDLITVRGQRLIERCPVCLYAGSLVPRDIIAAAPPDATVQARKWRISGLEKKKQATDAAAACSRDTCGRLARVDRVLQEVSVGNRHAVERTENLDGAVAIELRERFAYPCA